MVLLYPTLTHTIQLWPNECIITNVINVLVARVLMFGFTVAYFWSPSDIQECSAGLEMSKIQNTESLLDRLAPRYHTKMNHGYKFQTTCNHSCRSTVWCGTCVVVALGVGVFVFGLHFISGAGELYRI